MNKRELQWEGFKTYWEQYKKNQEEYNEKQYKFYSALSTEEGIIEVPFTLRESELEDSHKHLMLANLHQAWNNSPKDIQLVFLKEIEDER